MTDETVTNCNALKPVHCGCGGEAKVEPLPFETWNDMWDASVSQYLVRCDRCGMTTRLHDTEAEAVTAWNRAMGERTAKVVDYGTDIDAYDIKGVRTWCKKYRCENCGFIQFAIEDHGRYTYCPSCGARLEWE